MDRDNISFQADGSHKSRIAVLRGDDGQRYLADVFPSKEGTIRMSLANEAACADNPQSRIIAYMLDERDALEGASPDEIWQALTGRALPVTP